MTTPEQRQGPYWDTLAPGRPAAYAVMNQADRS
ncbi:MAG: hypothetical protein QOH97_2513, partial [Actinoplanes sp.]|nr:hypothetical protein [Actinoplanes sp.]